MPCAAEYDAVVLIRVLYEICAREEAAHAMPKEHVGKLRVLIGHDVMQLVHIVHDAPPAVLLGKKALLLGNADALAVAEVVVARDDKTVIRQKLHERPVAVNVLGDAVGDLHYRARLAVRYALERMDAGSAGARLKIKILKTWHGKVLLCVILYRYRYLYFTHSWQRCQ